MAVPRALVGQSNQRRAMRNRAVINFEINFVINTAVGRGNKTRRGPAYLLVLLGRPGQIQPHPQTCA